MAVDIERTPPSTVGTAVEPRVATPRRGGLGGVVTGALGAVSGALPHVLHHVGPLVGAAVLTGAAGTAAFGVLGALLSVPFLLRLRRRFGSWWAPAIGLGVFTALFLFSALVVGPLISGSEGGSFQAPTDPDHALHHE